MVELIQDNLEESWLWFACFFVILFYFSWRKDFLTFIFQIFC